jgi:hypothetical protein
MDMVLGKRRGQESFLYQTFEENYVRFADSEIVWIT